MPRNAHKLTITAALVSGVFLFGAGLSGCNRSESAATLVAEAKSYQQKGDIKAALIQYKNAVAKSPEDAAIRIALGQLYNDTGDVVSAEKEFRKAASLGATPAQYLARPVPGAAIARPVQESARGNRERRQRQRSGAADRAQQRHAGAEPAGPGQGSLRSRAQGQARRRRRHAGPGLGHAFSVDDMEGGQRYAEEAVAKDPKNPDVWMYKGMLAYRLGKQEEALAAYDQVLKLKPDHRSAHIEKAYLEIGMAKFDAAKADIDAAHKSNPGSLIVTYTQALLDFTQGKNEAAMESVQKVLRGVPDHMPSILLA
ncbi:tetratricopeptide repeat protein [Massilia sp. H-1]|nr:tetratricopeptide repeat protein [Massilia sp. H-1]